MNTWKLLLHLNVLTLCETNKTNHYQVQIHEDPCVQLTAACKIAQKVYYTDYPKSPKGNNGLLCDWSHFSTEKTLLN